MPGNAWGAQAYGKCHRKYTASLLVRVKWCGKSAPRCWQQQWQGKPHPEQDQIGEQTVFCHVWPARFPGRLLEWSGDRLPRGMIVHDRTRLIGRLPLLLFFLNTFNRLIHSRHSGAMRVGLRVNFSLFLYIYTDQIGSGEFNCLICKLGRLWSA